MIVYRPPINEKDLLGEPGATGFDPYLIGDTGIIGFTGVAGETGLQGVTGYITPTEPRLVDVKQGQVPDFMDLCVRFIRNMREYYTPYSIVYDVGYMTGEYPYVFNAIGKQDRVPLEVRTGIFVPNFQVGDKWSTGKYKIVWFYQDTLTSPVQFKETLFTVSSAGLIDIEQV